MNVVAAIGFLPPFQAMRALAGLPPADHPLYLTTVAMFVGLFGLGYLFVAVTARPDRFFITLAAAGKLSFFTLLATLWVAGTLPLRAVLAGGADLLFGVLFLAWLLG